MITAADVLAGLRAAPRHARAPRAELLAYQSAALRRLVRHAYASVPYYRALFDRHGVTPERIRTAADLPLIPIANKADLQRAPASDLVTRGVDPGRLLAHTTSGSSGEPLAIRSTWLEQRMGTAVRLRALHDLGMRATDRRVTVGLLRPHDPRDWDLPQRLVRAFGMYRKASLDCRLDPEEIWRRLAELRPDVLIGYPGVLAQIARGGRGHAHTVHPRVIIVGGEVLTPTMGREIFEAFGAPVKEHYGSHELGTIGWQCKATGAFHVADDGVVLEVLRDGRPARPGEVGEVVGTRLHTFAQPFIRYRLGDLVTQGVVPLRGSVLHDLHHPGPHARLFPAGRRPAGPPLPGGDGHPRARLALDRAVPDDAGAVRPDRAPGGHAGRAVARGHRLPRARRPRALRPRCRVRDRARRRDPTRRQRQVPGVSIAGEVRLRRHRLGPTASRDARRARPHDTEGNVTPTTLARVALVKHIDGYGLGTRLTYVWIDR